jgi:hypothetical protein
MEFGEFLGEKWMIKRFWIISYDKSVIQINQHILLGWSFFNPGLSVKLGPQVATQDDLEFNNSNVQWKT